MDRHGDGGSSRSLRLHHLLDLLISLSCPLSYAIARSAEPLVILGRVEVIGMDGPTSTTVRRLNLFRPPRAPRSPESAASSGNTAVGNHGIAQTGAIRGAACSCLERVTQFSDDVAAMPG